MRYRAYKKVSRWRQRDPHQKQYAPFPSVWDIIKDQITRLVKAYINLLLKDSWSEASSGSLYCLFDLGFMALQHLSGNFGHGQLT